MKNLIAPALCLLLASTALSQNTKVKPSNQFNPSIGMNVLSLLKNSSHNVESDGFSMQELEIMFSADVDAYFRAVATIGIHESFESHAGESEEEHEAHAHGSTFEIHPEEAYAESIALPYVTLKVGRFISSFGKFNAVHTHALPLIERGLVQSSIFGEEPLTESGLGLSFLIPIGFFSELSLEALQPTNPRLFESARHKTANMIKLKNLWDITDFATFELGLSTLSHSTPAVEHDHASADHTEAEHEEEHTEDSMAATSFDVTVKAKPFANDKAHSFEATAEVISLKKDGESELSKNGATMHFRYHLSQRWYAQLSNASLATKEGSVESTTKNTAFLVGFSPTEFSQLRAQYDTTEVEGSDEKVTRFLLQLNYAIGAHPAHNY